ncbi:MAG: FtsX-like permease family protein [Methylococcaceae bacterium]
MNTLVYKLWADVWLAKQRSLLAVLNIAIGVFCVGNLLGMIDIQLRLMDAAHQQSVPSHINLILRSDAAPELLSQIKGLPEVAGVDTMTPITMHYRKVGTTPWQTATLIIRPDYQQQHFDKTVLQTGAWPKPGTVAIENLSAQFTGLTVGDSIEVDSAQTQLNLAIGGVVRHPFIKPPKFGGQAHFFADTSIAPLFGVKTQNFRQLLVQIKAPYSADQARTVASQLRAMLAEQHIAVNVTLLQDPNQHWGRPFLAGLNEVLQIMALLSLAMACVLILNTVSAHMAAEINQIGILKALGASTYSIAQLYLGETLLMSIAALFIAIPLGVLGAYLSSCQLLGLFNIDCDGFEYSKRALAIMLLGGLLAPLLAALCPILRGVAIPVRKAIASYGIGTDFGYSRFDRWLERLGAHFLPTLYAAALGNLCRRKIRLLLTQTVLVLAGVMFLVLMGLIASVNLTLDNELKRSQYTVLMGFSSDQDEEKLSAIANSVVALQRSAFWQRSPLEISANATVLRQKGSLGIQMLALPTANALYQPLIESGRWLQPRDDGQRVLVISADTAQLNGLQAGDQVDVKLDAETQSWQIIGTYRWLAGNNFVIEPIYAPLVSLRSITKNKAGASFMLLNAKVANLAEENRLLQQLKQRFQGQGITLDAYMTLAKLGQREFAQNQFKPVISTLLGLAAMIVSIGGIGLSGTLAISVLQRTREIGVLRAIGASSGTVFRLFLSEGLLHGVIAWSVSIPLAYISAEPIARQLGKTMLGIPLDFAFDWYAVWYWLAIVFIMTCIAAFLPAKKAAAMSVIDSLSH